MTLCSGLVELVLGSIRDPLLRGRQPAEQHPCLAPPQPHEPVRWFFENLDVLDPADDFRGLLDVGDCGPDRRLGSVDGYLYLNEHGVSPGVRLGGSQAWGACWAGPSGSST